MTMTQRTIMRKTLLVTLLFFIVVGAAVEMVVAEGAFLINSPLPPEQYDLARVFFVYDAVTFHDFSGRTDNDTGICRDGDIPLLRNEDYGAVLAASAALRGVFGRWNQDRHGHGSNSDSEG